MLISVGGGSAAGAAVVEKSRTVVVYDVSGKIVHMHHSVTFAGGASLSDRDLQTRALKLARDNLVRHGNPVPEQLNAIHVSPSSIVPGAHYRVDPKSRSLSVIRTEPKRTARTARTKRSVGPAVKKKRR
jgi:hypothetical protein